MKVEGWVALATVVATLALLPGLVRDAPQARRAAVVAAVAFAVFAVAWGAVGPAAVPDALLVVIREGPEREVLDAVTSRHPWLPADVGVGVAPLRLTTWLHLLLGAGALALWVPLARAVAGPVGALALTATALASPWTVHAVLASGPGATLLFLAMVGAVLVAAARDERAPARALAAAALVATVALAALQRPESVLLGGPIAAWTAVAAAAPRGDASAGRALARVHPAVAVVALWALTTAGLFAVDAALAASPSTAVRVTDGSVVDTLFGSVRLPMDLLGFVPVGLASATLVGLVVALRRSPAAALLAAGTLLLARTYALAGHLGSAPFETLRYGTYLVGPLLLLALVGAAWVAEAGDGRIRTAWWGLLLLTAVLPRARTPHELAGSPWRLAVTTQTLDARFVADLLDRYPTCLVATRLLDPGAELEGRLGTAYLGGPQGPVTGPGAIPEPEALADAGFGPDLATLEELDAAAQRAGLPCLVLVEGLDCQLPQVDCRELLDGRTPDATVEADVPELNTHHPRHDGPTTLRALVLRPP